MSGEDGAVGGRGGDMWAADKGGQRRGELQISIKKVILQNGSGGAAAIGFTLKP